MMFSRLFNLNSVELLNLSTIIQNSIIKSIPTATKPQIENAIIAIKKDIEEYKKLYNDEFTDI